MENTTQSTQAEKTFTAGVNDLYDAWINPDKLKNWWKPAGNKLVNVENDVREGGAIKYEFEGAEGERTIIITGQYKEVKPTQRLVYNWNWQISGSNNLSNNHFELTIEFSSEGNGSKISITQLSEDKEESIHPRKKGWEDELESLNRFLG